MKINVISDESEVRILHELISQKVKKNRKEKNLSQLEVANQMGFDSPTFYSNAESNRENKHFSVEHLYLISKILNISLHELIPTKKELSCNIFKSSNKVLIK